jgi:hypothetical protein
MIKNGGMFCLKKLAMKVLPIQLKSKMFDLSICFTLAYILAGDEINKIIAAPAKKRTTLLKMYKPLSPVMFFQRMSFGSVILPTISTVSEYTLSSCCSSKSSYLINVEVFLFLES